MVYKSFKHPMLLCVYVWVYDHIRPYVVYVCDNIASSQTYDPINDVSNVSDEHLKPIRNDARLVFAMVPKVTEASRGYNGIELEATKIIKSIAKLAIPSPFSHC